MAVLTCLLSWVPISALAQEGPAPAKASTTITNLAQFWALSPTAGEQEFPVLMELAVNYYDPEWKVIWVGLENGGSYLGGGNKPLPFKSGQVVELNGVARPGKQEILWDRTKIKIINGSITIKPISLHQRIENYDDLNLRIIEAEGLVSDQVEIDSTHLRFELASDEWNITVYVHLDSDEAIPQFNGAFVRLRGVFTAKRDPLEKVTRFETWVAEASHVKVLSWLRDDSRFIRPATAIGELAEGSSSMMVRVEGVVHTQDAGKSLTLRDETGQVKLLARQTQAVKVGDRIEGIGFPDAQGPEAILRRSLFRLLTAASSAVQTQANIGLPKLRLTEQVRRLSLEEAARGYPVRIQGVVTWSDPETKAFFLLDGSGGVKVLLPGDGSVPCPAVETGVVVTGTTLSGDFVSEVNGSALAENGKRALPSPRSVTLEQALTGAEYAQWIEMQGYLRSVTAEGPLTRLELTTSGGEFTARVPSIDSPETVAGSVVQIRAVCDAVANERHQLVGVRLWVPSREHIQLVEPVPSDLFATPRRPICSLLQFNSVNSLNRRVQVAGVVLLHRPGQFLYVKDGDDSLLVLTRQQSPLNPGDRVDVVGFPGHEGWRLVMREAVYRRTARGPEPASIPLEVVKNANSDLDGKLVHVQGVLLDLLNKNEETSLQIQAGGTVFEAHWDGSSHSTPLLPLQVGSLLGLTGVYRVKLDEYRQPRAFMLNLRSSQDIQVIRRPSSWTALRVFWIAAGLLGAVLITVAWAGALSRKNQLLRGAHCELHKLNNELEDRVKERTRDLAQEIAERRRSEEALQESNQRFAIVTQATTDVIWDRNVKSNSVWWNENFRMVFGHSSEEIGADLTSWTSRIHPDDAPTLLKTLNAVLEGGGHLWSGEYRFRRWDGSYAFILDRGYVLRDEFGGAVRMIGAMQDITGRKQAEAKLQAAHQQLILTAREAGMAEVATGVLHNVGNVLNSVNVSSTLVAANIKKSRAANLSKVVKLMRAHEANLGDFFTNDPKGKQLPGYVAQLAEHLVGEQTAALQELTALQNSIDHIKDIVTMQQSYAKMSGLTETLKLTDLVEDALRMNSSGLARHDVEVVKQFEEMPLITTEKHKVLQILVNLIRNAKYACDDGGRSDKRITVTVSNGGGHVQISVQDNGIGIPAENLTRIFAHGFTTRKNGHGFGLHSGALAAKEIGGSLNAQSDGVGQGATFILELPVKRADALT